MSAKRKALPLFPLNTVLFPGMTLPLRVFEPRYLDLVNDCLEGEPVFGVVLIKEGEEVGGPAVPYEVGTTARILAVERKAGGILHLTTVGEERFRLHGVSHHKPYLVGDVELFPLQDANAPQVHVLFDVGMALLSSYLGLLSEANHLDIRLQRAPQTPEAMAHLTAMLLQVSLPVKQELLSIADVATLLQREVDLLQGEITSLTVMLRGKETLAAVGAFSRLSMN